MTQAEFTQTTDQPIDGATPAPRPVRSRPQFDRAPLSIAIALDCQVTALQGCLMEGIQN